MSISKALYVSILFGMLTSCSQASKPKSAVIEGTGNIKKQWLYLVKPDPWIYKPNIYDSVQTDNEGNFTLSADIKDLGEFMISGRGFIVTTVFLKNGYTLNLNISGKGTQPKRVTFSGEGSDINSFWFAMNRRFYGDRGFNKVYKKLVSENEPNDFLLAWDAYLSTQHEVVDSFVKASRPDKYFRSWLESYVKYDGLTKKLLYLFHKPRFKRMQVNHLSVDESYYSFLDDVKVAEMPKVFNNAYNNFLYLYISDYKARNATQADDNVVETIEFAQKELSAPVSNIATAHVLKELIESASSRDEYDKLRKLMADYKGMDGSEKYTAFLDHMYKKKAVLAPGSPAPDFTFKDIDGNEVTLSQYKGSVVVIDFWGTWCGPCKGQLPYSKKIEEYYSDRDDVVFLFVAMERGGREPWKSFVVKNELPGVHLYTNNSDRQLFPYKIESVPRYVIIDKDGNIFDAYAARPSGKMQQQIGKVLEL